MRLPISGWSIDTRTLQPGDLFIALHGASHDGHDYVREAFEKGARAALVERSIDGLRNLIVVRDTLEALQNLAGAARDAWGGQVVGVTGSAGKTTTKDAIAHLLAVEYPVGKTVGNFNNHFGLPLSILRLPEDCRIGVLEMGMNHAGEIRALAKIARPNVGVVTNVGYAHVEFFETGIEGVAAAKRELIEALPGDGTAVLNADDPRVSRFPHPNVVKFGFAEDADIRGEMLDEGRFRACGVEFETTLAGRHGISNLLAAIAVARVFGIAPERLREAVRSFSPGRMRSERMERDGITIWNDCYNSNPEAAKAMIDVLASTAAARRIAVLGEMLELGRSAEALHRSVGKYAVERGIDVVIGVRGAARHLVDEAVVAGLSGGAAHFFEDPEDAGECVRGLAARGDAILFKGSRGVRVERALERFLA